MRANLQGLFWAPPIFGNLNPISDGACVGGRGGVPEIRVKFGAPKHQMPKYSLYRKEPVILKTGHIIENLNTSCKAAKAARIAP